MQGHGKMLREVNNTICIRGKLNDVADPNVDDAQEALVLLLELLLVEDLNCKNAIFIRLTAYRQYLPQSMGKRTSGATAYKSKLSFQYGFRVLLETVVVRVCSPLIVATANGSGKPVV